MAARTDLFGMDRPLIANARDLERALAWFADVLDARLTSYFRTSYCRCYNGTTPVTPRATPHLLHALPTLRASPSAEFVRTHSLETRERMLLVLALIPHDRPHLLEVPCAKIYATERGF